jgi:uncharacterized protein YjbI with pentapeptide repeats
MEMADQQQFALLKSDVKTWNAWRTEYAGTIDLTWADLRTTNLRGADLSAADLRAANLQGADLQGADLTAANLSGSTDMTSANLRAANLSLANLRGTKLVRAELSKAILLETVFGNTDLRDATGLDSCDHRGPSILDHSTMRRSGILPLRFLRGCGLPDSLIEYLPSLLGKAPIQFSSCFISYSTQDEDFAERLHADLQNKGVRCWFAPHDIRGGQKLHEQIDQAIQLYDKLLLILSDNSMKSEWVKTEIAHARQKELTENRRVLFPISVVPFETIKAWKNFDADTGKDSAREIREYFIPDFSRWKTEHDAYTQAFDRLLKDLRTEKATGA